VELSPGIFATIIVVAIAIIVLIRWTRRQEGAAPVDARVAPTKTDRMAARNIRPSDSLVSLLLERASEETGLRVIDDVLASKRIMEAAAQARDELRTSDSATISLPFLTADAQGPKHFEVRIVRKPDSSLELQ
jgi:hypothetical protein